MKLNHKINLVNDLDILNPLIRDYLKEKEVTKVLSEYTPKLENASSVIEKKSKFKYREELASALENQYEDFEISKQVKFNLNLLRNENTFTVTTAHQLCLFTGPNYFIYKIISAIKTCQILKDRYPTKNFVPVYWMGSEDHDFDEINHAYVYGKKVVWDNKGKGAVGKLDLEGLEKAIDDLADILGERADEFIQKLRSLFLEKTNYGKGFQEWILDLFQDFGLIVLDQNDKDLKAIFSSVMQEELIDESAQKALVKNEAILETNYHIQASSRPINLFYLKDDLRERIVFENNSFQVLNTSIIFSKEDLLNELDKHPDHFSPNVILRPVYQESVLPNIAFIGGPGELAYWLQLKDVFHHFNLEQPLIILRDMAVVLPSKDLEKIASWDISVQDLFNNYDQLAKDIVEQESKHELELNYEKSAISKLFETIKEKAVLIDNNLERSVDSELQKVLNSFQNLEGKLVRAEKKNFEQKLSQLQNIQNKLLPNNTLQERYENFLPFYLKEPDNYLQILLNEFNPFENSLKVFEA